jgi:hypothetical protein
LIVGQFFSPQSLEQSFRLYRPDPKWKILQIFLRSRTWTGRPEFLKEGLLNQLFAQGVTENICIGLEMEFFKNSRAISADGFNAQ